GLTRDVSNAENYTTILAVAPSPLQKGVIWVGTDDGRLHVTRDGGKTWKSVASADLRGYAHVIEQDPGDKDLLFLGTEFGLWVSNDGGARWMKWTHGIPTTPVMGLAVH